MGSKVTKRRFWPWGIEWLALLLFLGGFAASAFLPGVNISTAGAGGGIDAAEALLERAPALGGAVALLGAAWAAVRMAAKVQLKEAERLGEKDDLRSPRVAGAEACDDLEALISLSGSGFIVGLLILTLANSGPLGFWNLVIAGGCLVAALVFLRRRRKRYQKVAATDFPRDIERDSRGKEGSVGA